MNGYLSSFKKGAILADVCGIKGRMTVETVSYTHLDVYKRQILVVPDDGFTERYGYVFEDDLIDGGSSVNYTVDSSEKFGKYDVYDLSLIHI